MKDRCEDEIPLKWPARQAARRPKKTAAPVPPRIPRITRLMALAIKFQEMIDRGEVRNYAELARLGFVTRARLTQIMNLLLLAPEIQEEILFLTPQSEASASLGERALLSLSTAVHWPRQLQRRDETNAILGALGAEPRGKCRRKRSALKQLTSMPIC